jgi:hypothetical protein
VATTEATSSTTSSCASLSSRGCTKSAKASGCRDMHCCIAMNASMQSCPCGHHMSTSHMCPFRTHVIPRCRPMHCCTAMNASMQSCSCGHHMSTSHILTTHLQPPSSARVLAIHRGRVLHLITSSTCDYKMSRPALLHCHERVLAVMCPCGDHMSTSHILTTHLQPPSSARVPAIHRGRVLHLITSSTRDYKMSAHALLHRHDRVHEVMLLWPSHVNFTHSHNTCGSEMSRHALLRVHAVMPLPPTHI